MTDDNINIYPNAWDFGNTDKELKSSDNQNKIEYYDLNEIAMGGPLAGKACWVDSDKKVHVLNDWCSGPPIWDTQGQKCAIPVWTKKFLKGTVQQIAVLDTKTKIFTTYKTTFDVLDMRTFDNDIISGYDSPKYKPRQFQFDITTADTANIQTVE